MIRRYNTNRDVTRQMLTASAFMILTLAAFPPALFYTAARVPTNTAIAVTNLVFYGCALLLFGFCVYRYFRWGEQDDAYLLSSKTLAIVGRNTPVRFIKPCDVIGFRLDPLSIITRGGKPLFLPNGPAIPGTVSLANALLATWFGTDVLPAARSDFRRRTQPQPWFLSVLVATLAGVLLAALTMASLGNWRYLSGFAGASFFAVSLLCVTYAALRLDSMRKAVYPLTAPAEASRSSCRPEQRLTSTEITRIPDTLPHFVREAAAPILTLFGIAIFVPVYRAAVALDELETVEQVILHVVAFEFVLLAAYCIWRTYQALFSERARSVALLSARTLAIVRHHEPVKFIKPEQCATLNVGRSQLLFHDGRVVCLPARFMSIEGDPICLTIYKRWRPMGYIKDAESERLPLSNRSRRLVVAGSIVLLFALGWLLVQSVFFPSVWATAVGVHGVLLGVLLGLYGYLRGIQGYGHFLDMGPVREE